MKESDTGKTITQALTSKMKNNSDYKDITTVESSNTNASLFSHFLTYYIFDLSLDILILFLILVCLSILVESFLIPCLRVIAKKYNLSERFTGYILAFGSSIPEFSTNLISATSSNGNINIGVGDIAGSGSYDFTLCFGIASFFAVAGGLKLNKFLYYKDSCVYLLTLGLLSFFLRDNVINFYETMILILLFPIYLIFSLNFMTKENGADSNSKFQQNEEDLKNTCNTTTHSEYLNNTVSIVDQTLEHIHIDKNSQDRGINFTEEKINLNVSSFGQANNIYEEEDENLIPSDKNNNLTHLSQNNTDISPQQGDVFPSNNNIFYSAFDKLSNLITYIYELILPKAENYSEFLLLIILFVTYLYTTVILNIVEKLSKLTDLTPSFLGMTVLAWGGNVGDTINASVATKLNAGDLLITTILGSQILNLQICLGLPWLISIIKNYFSGGPLQVNFDQRNPMKYIIPLFIVLTITIFTMTLFNLNLNRRSGICLIIIYFIYFIYEFYTNIK